MIEFNNVNKWYGQYHALIDVSETVAKGEVVVVCGPSGSGKSTLIRTINRLEAIDSGSIRFEGEDIHARGVDINRLRSRIGFVFQQFNLFPHLSVLHNCTLAPQAVNGLAPAQAREKAMALLERVGLAHKADAWPSELSGGQQQRVAIARALVNDPVLMLFDEITSALDPELVGEVLKVLESVAEEGMTMMLVTHEMNFAKNVADRVIFMHEGRIHEDGPARETLVQPRTAELRSFLNAVLH